MANDGIRIDINQLDFSTNKELLKTNGKNGVKENEFKCTRLMNGSLYSMWNGNSQYSVMDGINNDEAKYIIMEIKNAGLLDDDGCLDMEEVNNFLKERFNSDGGTKWESKDKDFTDTVKQEFYDLVEKIVNTYSVKETPKASIDTTKPGIKEQTEDDKKEKVVRVEIQNWGDTPIEGNNRANDCLYNIMKNYYPDIETSSNEWKELELQIMDLNPNIYGTVDKNGTWTPARNTLVQGSRQNSLIYNGEDIKLPINKGNETTPDEPAPQSEEPDNEGNEPQEYDMDKVVNNIKSNFTSEQMESLKNGGYVSYSEDDNLNVKFENGTLHIYDSTTGKELGQITIPIEDLGYVEQKTVNPQETLDEYNQILANHEDWKNDYVYTLYDKLDNQDKDNTEALKELGAYLDKMNEYSSLLDENSESYNKNIARMMQNNSFDLTQIYSHLIDRYGAKDANNKMSSFIANVTAIANAEEQARILYETGSTREAAEEFLSGYSNKNFIDNSSYHFVSDDWITLMNTYTGSIMYDNDYDIGASIQETLDVYNDRQNLMRDLLKYNLDDKLNEAAANGDRSKQQLSTLVEQYNAFMTDIYPKATKGIDVFNPHSGEAKKLKKEFEKALSCYINGNTLEDVMALSKLTDEFNTAKGWYS